jgi:hypothetical protein
VPIRRYLLFVGSALVALLFYVAPYFSQTPKNLGSQELADKSIIRIQSARKWPEKIVYDTSQPAVVPPTVVAAQEPFMVPNAEEPALSSKGREAFARMASERQSPQAISQTPRKRKIARAVPKRSRQTVATVYREPTPAWPFDW